MSLCRMRAALMRNGAALCGALLKVLSQLYGTARACAIDGLPSLFANGVQAARTTSPPADASQWALFTIPKAFASGAPVRWAEGQAELLRTLDSATVAAPYRWRFGDGAAALGHEVTHRYAHPGLYRIVVQGFNGTTRRWFVFDTALVRIAPPERGTKRLGVGYS